MSWSQLSSGVLRSSGFSPLQDGQGEDVSLDFESFRHNDGTLYSCFSHHGNRVYVDESQVREVIGEGRPLVVGLPLS